MKNKISIFFILILSLLFFSCEKELSLLEIRKMNYTELLAAIPNNCSEVKIAGENWFVGSTGDRELCYLDGVDERKANLGRYSQFTTSGLTLGPDTEISNSTRNIKWGINDPIVPFKENLYFSSPIFPDTVDFIDIIDSIFFQREWPIRSVLDSTQNVEVYISMCYPAGNGCSSYRISSTFGVQRGNFVRFKEVNKSETISHFIYDVHMEVACNLYLDPRYSSGDLWGRLVGEMKARFEVRK